MGIIRSIILSLVFTLLMAGCLQLMSECENKPNVNDKNNCYENLAIELKDASICDNVERVCGYPFGCHANVCYYNVGYNTRDTRSCDMVSYNKTSFEECYEGVAVGTNNTSMCSDIKNQIIHDECFSHIAESEENVSLCQNVQIVSLKNFCLSYFSDKGIISICRNISECPPNNSCIYQKSRCYASTALKTSNFSLCDELSAEKDNCYHLLAMYTGNSSLCGNIQDSSGKSTCLYFINEK